MFLEMDSRSQYAPVSRETNDMRMWMGICLVASVVGLVGCSKDAEVEAFIKDNDALVKSIKDAKDAAAAKKAWDDKKATMKQKFDGIKEARGFQVKKETMDKLNDSITKSTLAICDPTTKGYNAAVCKDYTATLTGQ
jgi:hypothetical protein